jgi:hypothetical protein
MQYAVTNPPVELFKSFTKLLIKNGTRIQQDNYDYPGNHRILMYYVSVPVKPILSLQTLHGSVCYNFNRNNNNC